MKAALAAITLALLTAGCAAEPSRLERDDQFWTAYEQRLGLVGTDYANGPAAAKTAAVQFGWTICDQLAKRIDQRVLRSRLAVNGRVPVEMADVQVETTTEFLCPEFTP